MVEALLSDVAHPFQMNTNTTVTYTKTRAHLHQADTRGATCIFVSDRQLIQARFLLHGPRRILDGKKTERRRRPGKPLDTQEHRLTNKHTN